MDITPFNQLKITMMTVIFNIEGGVQIEEAFHFLPITFINATKKIKGKVPNHRIPGKIVSLRYKDKVRGMNIGKAFANSVAVDMSMKDKVISMKLCTGKIQSCGAQSIEAAVKAANFLLKHLTDTQRMIDSMRICKNLPEVIQWVKDLTRGEEYYGTKITKNSKIVIVEKYLDHVIDWKDEKMPYRFIKSIVDYLLSFAYEYESHREFSDKLDLIASLVDVVRTAPKIAAYRCAMVNYNYNLGFLVDREALNSIINDTPECGMSARYNNILMTSVIVEIPYETEETVYKKKKASKITFLVYRTGSVTLSGLGGEIAERAYLKFMNFISEYYDLIKM